VEVDAIPPSDLRDLVRHQLSQHISDAAIEAAEQVTALERQTLSAMAAKLRAA
jgi:hypothetical protein